MGINILVITLIVIYGLIVLLSFAQLLYPQDTLGGKHNRTATINSNLAEGIVILDVLFLPIHYRGRFYATGYSDDGYKLMYLCQKKLYWLACIAEFTRRIVGAPEYNDPTIQLPPVEDKEDENVEEE